MEVQVKPDCISVATHVEEGGRSTHSFPPGWVLVGWCGCAVAASATAMRWHCVWILIDEGRGRAGAREPLVSGLI